jgi:uncharacterized protein (TIGR00299 family) protein
MKIAYFDSICGGAGDMILASMIDAGLDFNALKAELARLPLKGYNLKIEKTSRHHLAATLLSVSTEETNAHRTLAEIEKIVDESDLKTKVRTVSKGIFRRLAEAEAKVHGETVDNVHFHEVGMVDAIIDICGAAIGLDMLGIENAYCSRLTVGKGTVSTRHGTMPVPAPATSELLIGHPISYAEIDSEILTPTGAAILTTVAEFSYPPPFIPRNVGYGAGHNEHKELPNLLRLFIGETSQNISQDTIAVLETNLDRVSPEQIGFLTNQLLEAGSLDVFITPVQMKKNRPGQMLSVICNFDDERRLADMIFGSGCTLGIRRNRINRWKLARKEIKVNTAYGEIPVKLANYDGKVLYFPEFDYVARAAAAHKKNFDEIYFEILSLLRKET